MRIGCLFPVSKGWNVKAGMEPFKSKRVAKLTKFLNSVLLKSRLYCIFNRLLGIKLAKYMDCCGLLHQQYCAELYPHQACRKFQPTLRHE
jgi:hypothetical protein